MDKLHIIIIPCLILVLMSMSAAHGRVALGPDSVKIWFKKLPQRQEKVTNLHFYYHDNVSGPNVTVMTVAQSNITYKTPSLFGLVIAVDNLLTKGPKPNSKLLGRAQGICGWSAFQEASIQMNLNLVFQAGKYNGSTLSMHGYNPIYHEYREMAIVGGTGFFRLARGIATAKTWMFNHTSGNAIVEYDVMVFHY